MGFQLGYYQLLCHILEEQPGVTWVTEGTMLLRGWAPHLILLAAARIMPSRGALEFGISQVCGPQRSVIVVPRPES
jgi:hypothetical protein